MTPIFPCKFGVSWPFGSRKEVQNRFSRWRQWWPSWILDLNNFSYLWSTSHLNASYQVSSQLAFWFRRKSEKKILWPTIAAVLDFRFELFQLFLIYKSPWCFLLSFKSIGLSIQKKRQIDFQNPSWISDRNDISYFWSKSHFDTSYQVSSQLAFRFRRRRLKKIFKMAAMLAILDFGSEQF